MAGRPETGPPPPLGSVTRVTTLRPRDSRQYHRRADLDLVDAVRDRHVHELLGVGISRDEAEEERLVRRGVAGVDAPAGEDECIMSRRAGGFRATLHREAARHEEVHDLADLEALGDGQVLKEAHREARHSAGVHPGARVEAGPGTRSSEGVLIALKRLTISASRPARAENLPAFAKVSLARWS